MRYILKNFLYKSGFTLVESLVVIAVFALMIGAVIGFILMSYRTYSYAFQQSMAVNEARKGIEIMAREIREARSGDDGSYPIEKADDKEFIFYSDIDKDGATERVRYFLGTANSGSQTQECVTFDDGGSCSVSFSGFLSGTLKTAEVRVSVEGDFGWSQEYADVYADGVYLGEVCKTGCSDCAGTWEGDQVFDVTSLASDGSIQFTADANWRVNDICDWEESNHSMKVKFEFSWTEDLPFGESDFKKGVIDPVGDPPQYHLDQERIWVLTSYVRNSPPIFKYYDANGNEIEDYPSRLVDTKLIKLFLVVDVDPNRPPDPVELETSVQLRNLKNE
ncbi:prepilin-type N-terminal cleavage/methylation domain-containing protein [bacterium]|nr:prepilin-type N-terminal cleavage/methylation domain-containing protein [bacterium]